MCPSQRWGASLTWTSPHRRVGSGVYLGEWRRYVQGIAISLGGATMFPGLSARGRCPMPDLTAKDDYGKPARPPDQE